MFPAGLIVENGETSTISPAILLDSLVDRIVVDNQHLAFCRDSSLENIQRIVRGRDMICILLTDQMSKCITGYNELDPPSGIPISSGERQTSAQMAGAGRCRPGAYENNKSSHNDRFTV